ncbi:hypothetical protein GSUET_18320 [Geobacter sulfurreducens subsp. ethanolicus]|nr:hypothetical protein GSUET_18320 [Geobacter sulfurreducens subsp. ethanolicus]BET58194.1 hypothetical protein GEO60473_12340 [Geobacter sp. 60473]
MVRHLVRVFRGNHMHVVACDGTGNQTVSIERQSLAIHFRFFADTMAEINTVTLETYLINIRF